MCFNRGNKNNQSEDTTPFSQADIDAALAKERAEKAQAAAEATAAVEAENAAAGSVGTIKDQETGAANDGTLNEKLESMGGTQQAITNIQNQTFQEVKGASEKETLEIRRRKQEQLQRAIRQRRKSGFQGRRSLITGQSGGKGYA